MPNLNRLIKIRERTLEKYDAQVYDVFANGIQFLHDGRSPSVYNTGTEDVLKIPGWEAGQRSWRVSISIESSNVDNILLTASWQLKNIVNDHVINCKAVSIERTNAGATYDVILVDNKI